MRGNQNTWALVLAAGEWSRLRSPTTTDSGISIPKQFWSLRGGATLLDEALGRARALTHACGICASVAAQHQGWWSPQLGTVLKNNIIVQPQNRGTANGILMPLLLLLDRDPGARIVLLPSDHHVRDEPVLSRCIRGAFGQLQSCADETLLLGLEPEEADPELGYIIPGGKDHRGRLRVLQFVEKPATARARELIGLGALWNAFIVTSTVHALMALFVRRVPEVVKAMHAAMHRDLESSGAEGAIAQLYDRLPTLDFSQDILAKQPSYLRALPVPPCGWSDLGTPERVAGALRRSPQQANEGSRPGSYHVSLAAQHERLHGLHGEMSHEVA